MTEPDERLSNSMADDHGELDRIFESFRATPPGESEKRRMLFRRFSQELRSHIALEEELLFPRFRGADPGRRSITEMMLDEHRRIRDALDRIDAALREGSGPTDELEEELLNVLWAHNAREEEQVYPWFDDHLSPLERQQVLERLKGR